MQGPRLQDNGGVESFLNTPLTGLGIAIGIGFVIGLQREWAEDKPLGMRSFALISALGGLTALLLETAGPWPLAAGFLGLALVLAALVHNERLEGITTIIAGLLVYFIGAAAVAGFTAHAVVLGGVVTLLLHWKKPLHHLVERIGSRDFEIIARFILITLVVLPVLPNRGYGPYGVFNPFEAWLMVVLIVGINLASYVTFRLLGKVSGGWLTGVLGGLISSTATTISYAGKSKERHSMGPVAALIVLVASIVVYARVLLELAIVAPKLIWPLLGPALVFSLVLLVLGGLQSLRISQSTEAEPQLRKNPAQIKLALSFGALYVLILFAVAAARDHFGEDAIYAVALISGLTDVDALTLSMGQLFSRSEIAAEVAWRSIFLASLANLAFKFAAAAVLGSRSLRRLMLAAAAIALPAGAAILLFWP
jgi:uncharacterized membrane protein (DUF4010 family)